MRLEEAHQYEDYLRKELKKKDPENKALKVFYPSTWKAIEAYELALYGISSSDVP